MGNETHTLQMPGRGPRSGVRLLRDRVEDYFKANSVPAVVAPVGFKYRTFNLNQAPGGANRVVFIPGEFDGDSTKLKPRKYGTLNRMGRNVGAGGGFHPRELFSWDRPITVSVWSAPAPGQNHDEGLNLEHAEDLLEQVARACAVFGGLLRFGEVTVNSPPQENAFGAELLVRLTQVGPLYDVSYDVVQPKLVPQGTLT